VILLNNYILTQELKKSEEIIRPFGTEKFYFEDLKNIYNKVIAVGDVSSFFCIRNDLNPRMILYDYRIERKNIDKPRREVIDNYPGRSIKVVNPPGRITNELWQTIKEYIKSKENVKIFVDGEEDLALIPAVIESEENTIIIYGLRNGEGAGVIKVTKEVKDKFRELAKRMDRGS